MTESARDRWPINMSTASGFQAEDLDRIVKDLKQQPRYPIGARCARDVADAIRRSFPQRGMIGALPFHPLDSFPLWVDHHMEPGQWKPVYSFDEVSDLYKLDEL